MTPRRLTCPIRGIYPVNQMTVAVDKRGRGGTPPSLASRRGAAPEPGGRARVRARARVGDGRGGGAEHHHDDHRTAEPGRCNRASAGTRGEDPREQQARRHPRRALPASAHGRTRGQEEGRGHAAADQTDRGLRGAVARPTRRPGRAVVHGRRQPGPDRNGRVERSGARLASEVRRSRGRRGSAHHSPLGSHAGRRWTSSRATSRVSWPPPRTVSMRCRTRNARWSASTPR